jgi:hypothetical protein
MRNPPHTNQELSRSHSLLERRRRERVRRRKRRKIQRRRRRRKRKAVFGKGREFGGRTDDGIEGGRKAGEKERGERGRRGVPISVETGAKKKEDRKERREGGREGRYRVDHVLHQHHVPALEVVEDTPADVHRARALHPCVAPDRDKFNLNL